MRRKKGIIELICGALAVLLGWNLDLDMRLRELTAAIGFAPGSVAEDVVVGVGVPASILALAFISVNVYEKLLWPYLPGSDCCRGFWAYTLIAHTDQGDLQIAGWFLLRHTPHDIHVTEALAYYVDQDSSLVFRGEWTSDLVWMSSQRVSFVFSMVAQGVVREPLPSQYSGYMQLGARSRGTHGERNLWTGYFHDLGDRRGVHGPVVAVRTSRTHRNESPEKALLARLPMLNLTAQELVGAPVAPTAAGDTKGTVE